MAAGAFLPFGSRLYCLICIYTGFISVTRQCFGGLMPPSRLTAPSDWSVFRVSCFCLFWDFIRHITSDELRTLLKVCVCECVCISKGLEIWRKIAKMCVLAVLLCVGGHACLPFFRTRGQGPPRTGQRAPRGCSSAAEAAGKRNRTM